MTAAQFALRLLEGAFVVDHSVFAANRYSTFPALAVHVLFSLGIRYWNLVTQLARYPCKRANALTNVSVKGGR